MKSSKRQEGSSSTTRKLDPAVAASSRKGAGSGELSTPRGEDRDSDDPPPPKPMSPERKRFRNLLHRYWFILLLFSITWLAGAFFICSRLQYPIQLRILEQFSNFSLTAEFPFSFQDPEKKEEARRIALEQLPPVFDLKESKAGRIRESFRQRIAALLALPEGELQNEPLMELQKIFRNENALSLFFRCLDEVLDSGLLEPGWDNSSALQSQYGGNQEVIIFTDEHQIIRDSSSLLTIEEAWHKLEEDFGSRIGRRRLDLAFFREPELLEATLEYNEEKSRKLQEDALAKLEFSGEQFRAGDLLIEPSPREAAILATYLAAGKQHHQPGRSMFVLEFKRANLIRLVLLTFFIASYVFCLTRIRISPANLGQRLVVSSVALTLHFFLTFAAFYLYSIYDWPFAWLLCLLPLSLIPSLLANLLGGRIAICTAVAISALAPLQLSTGNLQYQLFHYSLLVTLVGVAFFQYAKQRRDFIMGGFAVGFAIMLSQVFFAFEQNTIFNSFILILPKVLVFSYANGFLVALLCMALLPLFESCFGLVTLTTLLELNDTNHPLLRRLQQDAPGTFQHSMNVATIAESAANSIQANALLTRVMALFHDIGKLENPGYFAENMRQGSNPHDHLAPEESCQIITSHVSDGMALAQQYHLRRAIRSAIEQHHGNSLLTYFYEKARGAAKGGKQAIPEESQFRYPHPPPLQKEIVIVSLADACEAAVRSLAGSPQDHSRLLQNAAELLQPGSSGSEDQERRLKEFLLRLEKEKDEGLTAENVERMINKIIDDKWSDNQFTEADITTSELEAIRQSFLRTFMDMYHFRPQYPGSVEESGGQP
ncbi:MAG: HDIG domain-containing protein [Lentisphaeria bacterium]|nr:HDIG domain-containing protein [Lentisphaeria bacterium]